MTIYNSDNHHQPTKRRRQQPATPVRPITGFKACPCCKGERYIGQAFRPCPVCKAKGIVIRYADEAVTE